MRNLGDGPIYWSCVLFIAAGIYFFIYFILFFFKEGGREMLLSPVKCDLSCIKGEDLLCLLHPEESQLIIHLLYTQKNPNLLSIYCVQIRSANK